MKSYWRVSEIARILRVHFRTVHKWIKSGKLPAYKIGRAYRVDKEEFEKWMASNEVTP